MVLDVDALHDVQTALAIFALALQPEERNATLQYGQNLMALNQYAADFEAALDLFEETEISIERARAKKNQLASKDFEGRKMAMQGITRLSRRLHIAARDGAVTLFNFSHALQNAKAGLKNCAALVAASSSQARKDAGKLFENTFPHWNESRNSVGHAAQFAIKSGDHASGGLYISDGIFGRRVTATVNGQLVFYDLTSDSLATLLQVQEIFLSSFKEIAERARNRPPN